jgi:transcriptional regulator with XRE-family HTH domain
MEKNNYDYTKAIKIIRSILGLNQQDFAKKLFVNSSYVSRIESGGKNPSKKFLKKIEETYDIPLEIIYLLSSSERNLVSISEKDAKKFGQTFLRLLKEV